jgi:hypothetical protein
MYIMGPGVLLVAPTKAVLPGSTIDTTSLPRSGVGQLSTAMYHMQFPSRTKWPKQACTPPATACRCKLQQSLQTICVICIKDPWMLGVAWNNPEKSGFHETQDLAQKAPVIMHCFQHYSDQTEPPHVWDGNALPSQRHNTPTIYFSEASSFTTARNSKVHCSHFPVKLLPVRWCTQPQGHRIHHAPFPKFVDCELIARCPNFTLKSPNVRSVLYTSSRTLGSITSKPWASQLPPPPPYPRLCDKRHTEFLTCEVRLVHVLRDLGFHDVQVTRQGQEVLTQFAVADDLTQHVTLLVIL